MKTLFQVLALVLVLSGCSDQKQDTSEKAQISENTVYAYKLEGLEEKCKIGSEVLCALEAAVKCVLNPSFEICKKHNLPDFIFMDDENLNRPTEESFSITKLKPLADGILEVYTKSECNGNMFGLCQGNIIYILKNKNEQGWRVTDIYAIE